MALHSHLVDSTGVATEPTPKSSKKLGRRKVVFPVEDELGFDAKTMGNQTLVVTEVSAGSAASIAGLSPGMRLSSLQALSPSSSEWTVPEQWGDSVLDKLRAMDKPLVISMWVKVHDEKNDLAIMRYQKRWQYVRTNPHERLCKVCFFVQYVKNVCEEPGGERVKITCLHKGDELPEPRANEETTVVITEDEDATEGPKSQSYRHDDVVGTPVQGPDKRRRMTVGVAKKTSATSAPPPTSGVVIDLTAQADDVEESSVLYLKIVRGSTTHHLTLTPDDLEALRGTEMLTDNVVMFGVRCYTSLVREGNLHIVDSLATTSLATTQELSIPSTFRNFVMPICEDKHWMLVVGSRSGPCVDLALVDSVGVYQSSQLERNLRTCFKKWGFVVRWWPTEVVHQLEVNSCGLCVIAGAKRVAHAILDGGNPVLRLVSEERWTLSRSDVLESIRSYAPSSEFLSKLDRATEDHVVTIKFKHGEDIELSAADLDTIYYNKASLSAQVVLAAVHLIVEKCNQEKTIVVSTSACGDIRQFKIPDMGESEYFLAPARDGKWWALIFGHRGSVTIYATRGAGRAWLNTFRLATVNEQIPCVLKVKDEDCDSVVPGAGYGVLECVRDICCALGFDDDPLSAVVEGDEFSFTQVDLINILRDSGRDNLRQAVDAAHVRTGREFKATRWDLKRLREEANLNAIDVSAGEADDIRVAKQQRTLSPSKTSTTTTSSTKATAVSGSATGQQKQRVKSRETGSKSTGDYIPSSPITSQPIRIPPSPSNQTFRTARDQSSASSSTSSTSSGSTTSTEASVVGHQDESMQTTTPAAVSPVRAEKPGTVEKSKAAGEQDTSHATPHQRSLVANKSQSSTEFDIAMKNTQFWEERLAISKRKIIKLRKKAKRERNEEDVKPLLDELIYYLEERKRATQALLKDVGLL